MRTSDVRTEGGIRLEKSVLAKGGTREDVVLVLDEAPDFMDAVADQLIERATTIKQDRDCFRLTDDEVVIEMPALKRPTLEQVQADWPAVKSIERDDSTEEAVTLRLSTVLKSTESRIDGKTYERRLMTLRTGGKLLGFQHRKWLLENQDKIADPKVRAALKALLGKVYIDFSGIIVVYEAGNRYVPYVGSDGRRWFGRWDWLGSGFIGSGRIAVSSK